MVIENLVGRVFATRNAVHLLHWKTKSYAQHVALNDLYEELIERVDAIVEAYQGAFGLIKDVNIEQVSPNDLLKHLDQEVLWIDSNREKVARKVRALENLVDNLTESYLKAIYKLRNLS
ncbi:MAG TPA: DUF5856 family protein [Methanosarcina sp.]|nr:DUF5856 family protein [Methanosarcina sp.]